MANQERYRQYIIPENVSDGEKIKGFKKRNVIEGVVLALFGLLLILPFRLHGTTFISASIFVCGPLLLLGAIGVQGDPLSIFVKNMISWFRRRGPILFNNTPRVLEESPVDAALTDNAMKTLITEKIDTMTKKVLSKDDAGMALVEGVDFEFALDDDEADLIAEKKDARADDEVQMVEDEDSFVAPALDDEFSSPRKEIEQPIAKPKLKPRVDLSDPETEDLF